MSKKKRSIFVSASITNSIGSASISCILDFKGAVDAHLLLEALPRAVKGLYRDQYGEELVGNPNITFYKIIEE